MQFNFSFILIGLVRGSWFSSLDIFVFLFFCFTRWSVGRSATAAVATAVAHNAMQMWAARIPHAQSSSSSFMRKVTLIQGLSHCTIEIDKITKSCYIKLVLVVGLLLFMLPCSWHTKTKKELHILAPIFTRMSLPVTFTVADALSGWLWREMSRQLLHIVFCICRRRFFIPTSGLWHMPRASRLDKNNKLSQCRQNLFDKIK